MTAAPTTPHTPQMPTPHADKLTTAELAAQAETAIRALNHRTRRRTGGLCDPVDVADLIGALAHLTSMLPQLLGQLTDWLDHEHHSGRLHVDAEAPHDTDQTLRMLTTTLQHATQTQRQATHQLDTAHQHAAHVAAVKPTQQQPLRHNRGQNPCRSVGPNHLTKRTLGLGYHMYLLVTRETRPEPEPDPIPEPKRKPGPRPGSKRGEFEGKARKVWTAEIEAGRREPTGKELAKRIGSSEGTGKRLATLLRKEQEAEREAEAEAAAA